MGDAMRVRIVVADQAEARFYDIEPPDPALHAAGRLSDARARLHDRDLVSDRPGRVFDHAPFGSGRRGAVAHHGTAGERLPHRHVELLFAHRIGEALALARREGRFDRIVLMADPGFLGLIRKELPSGLASSVAAEVPKDLVHQTEEAVRAHLPAQVMR
jgi:protein required for attachment to host cells